MKIKSDEKGKVKKKKKNPEANGEREICYTRYDS